MKKTSIIDMPRDPSEEDLLGTKIYSDALTQFIRDSETPITIALQGECGSGKTSLMKEIFSNLCKQEDKDFDGIWINTWEYFLQGEEKVILKKIIKKIMSAINTILKSKSDEKEYVTKLMNLTQDSVKLLANMFNSVVSSKIGVNVINEFEQISDEKTIGDFRKNLEKFIKSSVENVNNKFCNKGIIFFIDDLDRINPSTAVTILEILKNIFNMEHCVFILALDYDVVIKGLSKKYGELNEKNEREFRSYFDKIIQLPFTMPVESYDIGKLLKQSLTSIGYFKCDEFELHKAYIKKIIELSVGYNPRSIKRLINSLSLINLIQSQTNSNNEVYKKVINLALVCIQNSYPEIHLLLRQEPNFINWNENISNVLEDESLSDELKKYDIDEKEWVKFLLSKCRGEYHLENKFINIYKLFYIIEEIILKNKQVISVVIPNLVKISSFTSVTPKDNISGDHSMKCNYFDTHNNVCCNSKNPGGLRSKNGVDINKCKFHCQKCLFNGGLQ